MRPRTKEENDALTRRMQEAGREIAEDCYFLRTGKRLKRQANLTESRQGKRQTQNLTESTLLSRLLGADEAKRRNGSKSDGDDAWFARLTSTPRPTTMSAQIDELRRGIRELQEAESASVDYSELSDDAWLRRLTS